MVSEADRVIASLDYVPPELNEGYEEEMGLPAPPPPTWEPARRWC